MKRFYSTIGGDEFKITHHEDGSIRLEGMELPYFVKELEPHVFQVSCGELSRLVLARRDGDGYQAMANGISEVVVVETDRDRLVKRFASEGQKGPHRLEIRAPMPARIVRIQSQVGDQVETGQSLLILEAMKMENELRAHQSASIKEIRVSLGQAVEKGELLIVLE